MIMIRENSIIPTKTSPITILSVTNPTYNGVVPEADLRNDRVATNRCTTTRTQTILSGALYRYRNVQPWNWQLTFF
jgi:hypothetical protein